MYKWLSAASPSLQKSLKKCQGNITGHKHFLPLQEIVLEAYGLKSSFPLVP